MTIAIYSHAIRDQLARRLVRQRATEIAGREPDVYSPLKLVLKISGELPPEYRDALGASREAAEIEVAKVLIEMAGLDAIAHNSQGKCFLPY